jgi:hypothetical protein
MKLARSTTVNPTMGLHVIVETFSTGMTARGKGNP